MSAMLTDRVARESTEAEVFSSITDDLPMTSPEVDINGWLDGGSLGLAASLAPPVKNARRARSAADAPLNESRAFEKRLAVKLEDALFRTLVEGC
jgi:hypothetical protein